MHSKRYLKLLWFGKEIANLAMRDTSNMIDDANVQ